MSIKTPGEVDVAVFSISNAPHQCGQNKSTVPFEDQYYCHFCGDKLVKIVQIRVSVGITGHRNIQFFQAVCEKVKALVGKELGCYVAQQVAE